MAGFIAKQVLGSKISEAKGQLGNITGGGDNEDEDSKGEDPEVVEARRQEELERKARHAKFEAEREVVRNDIRAKYNLEKRVDPLANIRLEMAQGGGKKGPPSATAAPEEEEEGFLDTVLGFFKPITEKLGIGGGSSPAEAK